MSDDEEDGGPAFPHAKIYADTSGNYKDGMSLRDWFAGQALAGLLSNTTLEYKLSKLAAEDCYEFADAMLAARDK